ncbi:MAG: DUF4831 family protein [Bacteroidales bacterium]|nr:DUF4831 family protein [Bacteroidales bacterium]
MKHLRKLFLVMALTALAIGNASAQYVTTHAKAAMPGQQNGLYYSLPRTVLQLNFIIEETQFLEGPYSQYANYIGAQDYVMEDSKEYELKGVTMTSKAEPDPQATFFVAMTPKKDNTTSFCLTPQGILQGVGMECPAYDPDIVVTPTIPQECSQEENFNFRYGSVNARGEEQAARSAADMINRIREEKLKLITGFQETAFTLDTYRQMYADLDAMENDYLSLFVGKKLSKTIVKTVYVTPNKEVTTQSVAKFSSEDGLTVGTSGYGDVITVQLISLQTTGTINSPSQSAVESLSLENKLFYRIPEIANVKVSMGGKTLLESRETIAQYGVFMLAPLAKTKLMMDPRTGQIVSLGME